MSGGLHVFIGPDRPRKLQRIHELERALGIHPFDRHHLDGAETSAAALLALCRQQPAGSPVRLIVVDDAHRLEIAGVGSVLRQAELIAKTAYLVLLVETELSLRHPLAQASPALAVERFPGRSTPSAKPFALTDALGSRDAAGALAAVRDQLLAGKEPLELLGLVAWQLQRWMTVKRLRDADSTTAQIVLGTGLKPWQAERAQTEVARRSLESLQRLLERCWRLDVDAKSGRALPALALDQLLVEICLNADHR